MTASGRPWWSANEEGLYSLIGHEKVDEFGTNVVVVRVDSLDTLDLSIVAHNGSWFLVINGTELVLQVPSGRKFVLSGSDDHRR